MPCIKEMMMMMMMMIIIIIKVKQSLYRPLRIQEADAPRFHDNRHMKAVRLSPAALTPNKYSWFSFLLEAESTTGSQRQRAEYVDEKFQ